MWDNISRRTIRVIPVIVKGDDKDDFVCEVKDHKQMGLMAKIEHHMAEFEREQSKSSKLISNLSLEETVANKKAFLENVKKIDSMKETLKKICKSNDVAIDDQLIASCTFATEDLAKKNLRDLNIADALGSELSLLKRDYFIEKSSVESLQTQIQDCAVELDKLEFAAKSFGVEKF